MLRAQAQQSVVAIDGVARVAAFQSKVLLAVVASCFGGCYDLVMTVAIELNVVSQLFLLYGRDYSSVLSVSKLLVPSFGCGCS